MKTDQDRLDEIKEETINLWNKHYSKHIRKKICDWSTSINNAITSNKIKTAKSKFISGNR